MVVLVLTHVWYYVSKWSYIESHGCRTRRVKLTDEERENAKPKITRRAAFYTYVTVTKSAQCKYLNIEYIPPVRATPSKAKAPAAIAAATTATITVSTTTTTTTEEPKEISTPNTNKRKAQAAPETEVENLKSKKPKTPRAKKA